MSDPMIEAKDQLLQAVLPNIPFDGWTLKGLSEAAMALGWDPTMGERCFPRGPLDAVLHFIDFADRRLAKDAESVNVAEMRLSQRVGWLVRQRIGVWGEHRESIRRAVSLLSLPSHAAHAVRATWGTADLIWHLAGDQSVDFRYYTKRATLSAVYSATLLTWLSDTSEDFADTWRFMDRRLADLATLPKKIEKLRARFL